MLARYEIACGVHRLAQHFWTCSITAVTPQTCRKVSCWPAKDADGRSSAVALERTATASSGAPAPGAAVRSASAAYARITSAWMDSGTGAAATQAAISRLAAA